MRAFYAFMPDLATRTRLAAAGEALPLPSMARRVAPEDLHLTLAFLGEVAGPRLAALQQLGHGSTARRLASERPDTRVSMSVRSCRIEFGRYEFWPRTEVVVAAALASSQAVNEFCERLRERIATTLPEQPFDATPLRAHVTLARRVAPASGLATMLARPPAVCQTSCKSAAGSADASSMVHFTWYAESFSLLLSNGPHAASRYTVLDTWPLLYE